MAKTKNAKPQASDVEPKVNIETEDTESLTEETQSPDLDQEAEEESVPTHTEPPVATPIKPNNGYSRLMQFPAEVTLPMSVVVEVGAPNRRYQILSDGQEVPKAIIDWLKSDARYMRWFAQ